MLIKESTPDELQKQIAYNTEDLNKIKELYQNKIELYTTTLDKVKELIGNDTNSNEQLKIIETKMNDYKSVLDKYVEVVNKALSTLDTLKENEVKDELIYEYNNYYNQVQIDSKEFNENVDNILTEFKEIQKSSEPKKEDNKTTVMNNPVLLVSELQNKVVLPYTGEEIEEIVNDNDNEFNTPQEVIEHVFTRKLTDYRDTMFARYRETYNLAFRRENYSRWEAMKLAMEVCRKKFLHPAIISACRSVKELDVYLDCLNKNELEDFKIFEIKYEIPPMLTKYNKIFSFFHNSEKYDN